MTAPPAVKEGSGSLDSETFSARRRRQIAEELILSGEGSGSGSGLGSGLGSGIILSESGSGIDGVDPTKLESEEEMNIIETKNGLLQAENVLPVTSN